MQKCCLVYCKNKQQKNGFAGKKIAHKKFEEEVQC